MHECTSAKPESFDHDLRDTLIVRKSVALNRDQLLQYGHKGSAGHTQHQDAVDSVERAEHLPLIARDDIAIAQRSEIDRRVVRY